MSETIRKGVVVPTWMIVAAALVLIAAAAISFMPKSDSQPSPDAGDKQPSSGSESQENSNIPVNTTTPAKTPNTLLVDDSFEESPDGTYEFTKITGNTYVLGTGYYFRENPNAANDPVARHDEKIGIVYASVVKDKSNMNANFQIYIDMENNPEMLDRLSFKHEGIIIDSFKVTAQGSGTALQATVRMSGYGSKYIVMSGKRLTETPKRYQSIDDSTIEATIAKSELKTRKEGEMKLSGGINNLNGKGLGKTKILLLKVFLSKGS